MSLLNFIVMRPLLKTYTFRMALSIAAGLLAAFIPVAPFQAILAAAYAAGCAMVIGDAWTPNERATTRLLLGIPLLAAAIAIVGAIVYFVADLALPATVFVIAAAPACMASAGLLAKLKTPATFTHGTKRESRVRHGFVRSLIAGVSLTAQLGVAGYAFSLLTHSATDLAIRSPWDAVPRLFLLLLFIVALFATMAAVGDFGAGFSLATLAILATLVLAVARLTYTLGFGFDPFIHRATEAVIMAHGAITPKPLYYLGHYAIAVVAARLSGSDIAQVDLRLVPWLFVACLPLIAWALRRTLGKEHRFGPAAALTLLVFPLSSFIATTPQGLANIFLLAAAFVGLAAACDESIPVWLVVAFAVAAAAVHPLAGLPLIFFAILLVLRRSSGYPSPIKKNAAIALIAAGGIAVPLAFAINGHLTTATITFDPAALWNPAALAVGDAFAPHFDAFLDAAYFWRSVRVFVLIAAALAGYLAMRRRHPMVRTFAGGAAIFALNYFFLATVVRFPFLIQDERANYAARFAEITLLFLAPLAAAAFALLLERLAAGPRALRVGLAALLAFLVVASTYLSYPRRDGFDSSRGWSTSRADINAVRSIQKDSQGADYVALANQSTSAAALREFGFAKYFASNDADHPGELFYYPIPTGEPLYAEFLAMNEKLGSRAEADKVMDMAGVNRLYYVVNDYWWRAQRITANAKREANAWWSVDGGKAYVFRYDRKK